MSLLEDIPSEILLHIFLYISPKCLLTDVVLVCKRFHELLSNDEYWRFRLAKFDNTVHFPPSTVTHPTFSWRRACSVVCSESDYWRKGGLALKRQTLSGCHIAPVDAVHLMQGARLCISGSRDRTIGIWNLSTSEDNNRDEHLQHVASQEKAHEGWIWCLTSVDQMLYSGSWDRLVRQWQVGPTGLLPVASVKCTAAVLSVVADSGLVFASTYDHHVQAFDPRSCSIIETLNHHSGSVLGLARDFTNHNLYSCSADGTVVSVDIRTRAVVHRLRLENYGMSLSCSNGEIWVGDKAGKINLLDYDLQLLSSFEVSKGGHITDVNSNLGCVISSCTDKFLRFTTPGSSPRLLNDIELVPVQPTKIDYSCGVLAAGMVDSTVSVWCKM